ncbi:hypothetical protein NRB_26160 [Novosphingobium sp. 11B]
MIPFRYFYLVDIETEEPLALFSADHCRGGRELHHLEARIRVDHDVDDITSGIALRDSAYAPLPSDQALRIMRNERDRRIPQR